MAHITCKRGRPGAASVLAGETQMLFAHAGSSTPQLEEASIKAQQALLA